MDMSLTEVREMIEEVIEKLEAEYPHENPDLFTVNERLLEAVGKRELEVALIDIIREVGIEQVRLWVNKEERR